MIYKQVKIYYNQLDMRTFYRVNHYRTGQGLWYNYQGDFTGLIHDRFSFCKNKDLAMDFDPDLVGWLSATPTVEELHQWFPHYDLTALAKDGWYLHEYNVPEEHCRFYDKFQHWLIRKGEERLMRIQNFGLPV